MNILVNCKGWIGDCLFAASLAKKLKEKYPGCRVEYVLPVIQPQLLLEQNPYIDEVYVGSVPTGARGQERIYHQIINIPEVDQQYPATMYMQAMAGIEDQSPEFDVYVPERYALLVKKYITSLREACLPVVAWQRNWTEKSFEFTREEYDRAIDVPNHGYGGRHRNIVDIIRRIEPKMTLACVGFPDGVGQNDKQAADPNMYTETAAIIQQCDWFIGSEGGLSNLAAAVGTKCIITTDFIWQLYGPKGVIKRIENPAMGPATYYPDAGHVHLDPYLTDEEVAEAIIRIVTND